ncbi:MAG: phosphoheptose isomerase family protein [Christensenellales bacterium]
MENQKEQMIEELGRSYLATDVGQLDDFIAALEQARRIFFYAQGREMLMLSAFAMRVHHMGYEVYVIGETSAPPIGRGDVLAVSSGTGAGGVLFAQIETALRAGAAVIGLSAHPENRIGKVCPCMVRVSGQTLADPLGRLPSMLPLGTGYEQSLLLTLDYVVLQMMRKNRWEEGDLSVRHTNLE